MFTRRFRILTLLGFPIYLDLSWFLVLILIVWSLAASVFPESSPGLTRETYWAMGAAGAIGLFVSILLHELAHAVVARLNGLEMGGITLFIFGGVAEMRQEPPSAIAEFQVAIAGPIMSALIAGVCFLASLAPSPEPVSSTLGYLALINLILVIFNMIPAFPLDGGRILRAGLWAWRGSLRWATRIASSIGSMFGALLIGLALLSAISGALLAGVWWLLIGMFIINASRASYQSVLVRRALEGEPVSRFMRAEVVTVPPDLTLEELVGGVVYRHFHKMYPVVDEHGSLLGCVSTARIKAIERDRWASTLVRDAMDPCSPENTVRPETDAIEAMSRMQRSDLSRLLVASPDGALAGVVTLRDLLAFLSLRMELDDDDPLRRRA